MDKKEEIRKKSEKIIFPSLILLTAIIGIIAKDSFLSVFAAVCGMSYTILAGKGKIYCYLIGMAGTLCYAYLAFKNALYGNCALYALYYFPMEITGIIMWKKHLNKETDSVIKTSLPKRQNIVFWIIASVISLIAGFIAIKLSDSAPFFDAFATVFSLYGMYLTVKRCIEQWDVWFFVNVLSFAAWVKAYINGSGTSAIVIMWLIYIVLAVYFKHLWKTEIKAQNIN